MKGATRVLMRSPKFLIGVALLVMVGGFVLIYPFVDIRDPFEMVGLSYEPPSKDFPLGTDNFGRDVLLELAYGTRSSLYVGILAGGIALCIGVVIGLLAGYLGGFWDNILTTVTNMFIVIPSFMILILVSIGLNSRSLLIVGVIIGCTTWPWTARAVRAQTASLRLRDHVHIARISGYGVMRIIVTQILPYIASYVFMAFILQTASGILAEASISMLGLGPYNTISLGTMLNWAIMFEAMGAGAWWAFIPPALLIALFTFALFLINSGLDEIFNPKIRR
ncbi:ABC-type transporter, integral membrane subunit [Spirochaeta thermophila DSM 6578]|uniref:ABC-type transporter, integral membrane subunit n=1 Tax=Winmispira thermophila (strain ATCC 700085 / DSM 6578 / Z-1203) TaxID=869211 RepID=G0GB14_WINT7|nr:ABC transporter permease [Spirochaeta thermophila]AEJ61038.1 ABC-type transporter, integral membrane subunit [Spirochaeta thermophila DSM 6578]